ncbi:MAG TPA: RNA polymerase sigma factor [Polyangiaceae bacterium]|nr:RNA polymerase sigma factor [Polyangiaceae bacterium]
MSPATRAPLMLVPAAAADSEGPGPPELDDSALLAGLKARDVSLSKAFYSRVRPIVDRTLARLLGTRDNDYEDVAQRALFELVSTIDRFRGECPLDAWISIVTARVAYRTIRRRRTERKLFVDETPQELQHSTRSHANTVAARQAIQRVRSELERMNPDRAWTFLLHDVYGYDLKEVGQITGASLSAAQSRLVRGRREIHERIRQDTALARFLKQYSEEE